MGPRPEGWADHFFVGEVQWRCEFALRAFGEMGRAHAEHPRNHALLALAHVLVLFAGNVAKLLTASDKDPAKVRARAKRLCGHLGLTDLDFAPIMRARNFFEHFDERMDRYLGDHEGLLAYRHVLDHAPDKVTLDDQRVLVPSFLQFLNTSTLELTLYDETFQLGEIVKLVQRIQDTAASWLARVTGESVPRVEPEPSG
jgi:hypothetical protein